VRSSLTVDTRIAAVGVAESYCYECPKPEEFGDAGLNWGWIGWRIRVRFKPLTNLVRPKDHMSLPDHCWRTFYAPSAQQERKQAVYLT
jgi:hypothetical protein